MYNEFGYTDPVLRPRVKVVGVGGTGGGHGEGGGGESKGGRDTRRKGKRRLLCADVLHSFSSSSTVCTFTFVPCSFRF
jgi:hypothetical protein